MRGGYNGFDNTYYALPAEKHSASPYSIKKIPDEVCLEGLGRFDREEQSNRKRRRMLSRIRIESKKKTS